MFLCISWKKGVFTVVICCIVCFSESSSDGEGTEEEEKDCKVCGGGRKGGEATVRCSQCAHHSKSTKGARISLFPISSPPGWSLIISFFVWIHVWDSESCDRLRLRLPLFEYLVSVFVKYITLIHCLLHINCLLNTLDLLTTDWQETSFIWIN